MFITDKEFTWEMSDEFDEWAWQQCVEVSRAVEKKSPLWVGEERLPSLDDLSLSLMGM